MENVLARHAAGVVRFRSPDLTTANPNPAPPNGPTTPADNSIVQFADGTPLPGWSNGAGSFLPTTDRAAVSAAKPNQTPIAGPVPGTQIQGWFADDPAGQARFVLRLPDAWNGNLVVAGAPGTRSEFAGDMAWSDYVVQKGYAYASQNKGVLNFYQSGADDCMACRHRLLQRPIHFYDVDPEKPFTQWTDYMLRAALLAKDVAAAHYGRPVGFTYAVGTSNGGYQVRRALEHEADLFDGGVDWEGTLIDPNGPNVLIDLPPVLRNFPTYAVSFNPNSQAAINILSAGYPPDIVHRDKQGKVVASLWQTYYDFYWEATFCQWQKRFDPGYDTYRSGAENYAYFGRRKAVPELSSRLAAVATTGKIRKPMISIAGTMDALLPIQRHARSYQGLVRAACQGEGERQPQYRLYEVQNGNHIELLKLSFPELELMQPHAQHAFDLLVAHVEQGASLPPDQCIPRGGVISAIPAQSGHCTGPFVPKF